MNKIRKVFLLLCFIATFMFPLLRVHADGNISGKVIDVLSTTPMANVKVTLVGFFSQETMTDEKGFYQFLSVPSGEYKVQVECPSSYLEVSQNPLLLNVLSSDIKANFSLGVPGNIEGRVIDDQTQLPIAQANVDVMRGNNLIYSVLTDDNGMYTVSALSPRPYIVRVRMPPYFQSNLQLAIPISNQTITVDFSLKFPPGKVNGTIRDAITEQPIGNATVNILENGLTIESVQSNENGSYTISELTPNHYQIKVSAYGFKTTTQDIFLSTNQTLTTDFALNSLGTINGQVLDAFTGKPIVGACIGIWQDDALFTVTHTDENGNFSAKGLGHFQVVVQSPNFRDSEQGIDILSSAQTVMMHFNLVCFEPSPPPKVFAQIIYKRLVHQVNRVHRFRWEPSPSQSVVSYHIYRGKKLIAKIPANDPLMYNDEWRSQKTKTYHIIAVDQFGQESKPLSITIK